MTDIREINELFSLNSKLLGNKELDSFPEVGLELLKGKKQVDYIPCDIPLISAKSKEIFEKEFPEQLMFFRLELNNQEVFTFKIKNTYQYNEILDLDNSEILFWNDGGVKEVRKYTFKSSQSPNVDILSISDIFPHPIIVSENFKNTVKKFKLTNFDCSSLTLYERLKG